MRRIRSLVLFLMFLTLTVLFGCKGNSPTSANDLHILNDITISTNNSNIAQQDIYNDTLVWAGGNIRDKSSNHLLDTIYEYNFIDKKIKAIAKTKKNGQTDETQVNEDWICWTDWFDPYSNDWTIYAYSRKSKEVTKIASSTLKDSNVSGELPRLSLSDDGLLAWVETQKNDINVLKVYNLNTKKEKIIEGDVEVSIPSISNGFVTWTSNNTIHIYSLINNEIIYSIKAEHEVEYPKISKKFIVWKDGDDLYLQSMEDLGINKTNIHSGDIFYYDVSDSFIVWQTQYDIYAYSIEHKSVKKVNEKNGILPIIHNEILVWQEQDANGDFTLLHVKNLNGLTESMN